MLKTQTRKSLLENTAFTRCRMDHPRISRVFRPRCSGARDVVLQLGEEALKGQVNTRAVYLLVVVFHGRDAQVRCLRMEYRGQHRLQKNVQQPLTA